MKTKKVTFASLVIIASIIFLLIPAKAQVVFPGSFTQKLLHLAYIDSIESEFINRQIFYQSSLLENSHILSSTNQNLNFIDPEIRVHYNSTFPFGYNDGPIWKGRGFTPELVGGAQVSLRNFHLTFAPTLYWSQNLSFPLAEWTKTYKSQYAYQYNVGGDLDWVERYGDQSFSKFHPGQSEVRYLGSYLTLAASTQNLSFGPSTVNPIILSRNGPGIPHIEIGTPSYIPVKIKNVVLGKVKGNLYHGLLSESEYFDENPENDDRYFQALTLSYLSPGPNTLKLGINRVFYLNMENFQRKDLIRSFAYFADEELVVNSRGDTLNDFIDQMISFTFEWYQKPSDLRLYFEIAKNDFFSHINDLVTNPDNGLGYSIGFDKVFKSTPRTYLLTYEFTNIKRNMTFLFRPTPSFYSHGVVRNGYTEDGQIIGAGIGLGSDSHILEFTVFNQLGFMQASVQRVQINDDYFLGTFGNRSYINNQKRRSVAFNFGYNWTIRRENWSYSWQNVVSGHLNRYWDSSNDVWNYNSAVVISYHISK